MKEDRETVANQLIILRVQLFNMSPEVPSSWRMSKTTNVAAEILLFSFKCSCEGTNEQQFEKAHGAPNKCRPCRGCSFNLWATDTFQNVFTAIRFISLSCYIPDAIVSTVVMSGQHYYVRLVTGVLVHDLFPDEFGLTHDKSNVLTMSCSVFSLKFNICPS